MRPDFVEQFMTLTEGVSSPAIFRKWGAISAIAGALERKVWIRSMGSKLYPNMYVILAAPPGVGKTEVTWRVRDMLTRLEDHCLGSTSLSKASMIDELAAANRRFVHGKAPNPVDHFNTLLICMNELGVLLPAYDNEFMNTLTDLWDCKGYSEKKRTSKLEIEIKAPQISMLAACTPSYLNTLLPEGAWDQGLTARLIIIYSGDRQITSLFDERPEQQELEKAMEENLKGIGHLYGELKVTKEAAQLLEAFHKNNVIGNDDAPDHPKLVSYVIRRTVHLLKLCMVAAVSASNELLIRDEDVKRALGWLLEAEEAMPDVFKAMSGSGQGKIMEEAWYYVFKTWSKEGKKPVLHSRLLQFLQERVPVHNIEITIKLMEQAEMIEKRLTAGGKGYIPKGQKGPG